MGLENVWHVLPNNDLAAHMDKCIIDFFTEHPVCHCLCEPRLIIAGQGFVVVHNSFDGREGVECVVEILNNQ